MSQLGTNMTSKDGLVSKRGQPDDQNHTTALVTWGGFTYWDLRMADHASSVSIGNN